MSERANRNGTCGLFCVRTSIKVNNVIFIVLTKEKYIELIITPGPLEWKKKTKNSVSVRFTVRRYAPLNAYKNRLLMVLCRYIVLFVFSSWETS